MRLGADDLFPVFRIIVAAGHDYAKLFVPFRTQLQKFIIDLHGYRSGISNDHRLTGQKIRPVFLIMLYDIIAKRIDRGISPKNALHLTEHLFALFDGSCIRLLLKDIICGIYQSQGILIQF